MNTRLPHDTLFQNLFQFHRDFDRLFGDMLNGGRPDGNGAGITSNSLAPAVEAYVDKVSKTFRCQVVLPGLKPNDIKINAQGNTLTISGERKIDRPGNEVEWIQSEIWYGAFERTISLPEGVQTDRISAEYRDGVLLITAPLSASALPRRIEIQSGESKHMTMQA